jgi:hypothetical protein
MSIAARLKDMGSIIAGFAVLVGIVAIGFALLTGAAEFSLWVLEWTFSSFWIALLVSIVLLAPLSLIPSARGFSAIGFMLASIAFSTILWLWGMAYTYSVWGMLGVVIGLVLLGIGVVPVAMVAALIYGDWPTLGMFVVTGIASIGFRGFSGWLAEKADERAYAMAESRRPAAVAVTNNRDSVIDS